MRLAEFIVSDLENILVRWEEFAGSNLPAATSMTPLQLRDHAEQILRAVALDMSTAQSKTEQSEKSKGHARKLIGAPETAAETHGFLRAKSGFNIEQLVAEYRALRSSVLTRWIEVHEQAPSEFEDMVRFNEAIDQAVAESVTYFSTQMERSRNLMLGMLGHDMRSPLMTIQNTALHLAMLNAGGEVSVASMRLINSGRRINALVEDLVDYNMANLGVGVRIDRSKVDLARLFADELQQLEAAYPDRKLELIAPQPCVGLWDGARLQRVLANLVANAVKYGAPGAPVKVELKANGESVQFEVRNVGSDLSEEDFAKMCEPLKRGIDGIQAGAPDGGLGLGLYIASEIAKAHGGSIECRPEQGETIVAVRLPVQSENRAL